MQPYLEALAWVLKGRTYRIHSSEAETRHANLDGRMNVNLQLNGSYTGFHLEY
jgi:hypothetical protein